MNLIQKRFPTVTHLFWQSGISDIQITNLKYQNNTYCHIFNSWMNPFKEHRLVISGDKGHIDFFSSKNDHHFEFFPRI